MPTIKPKPTSEYVDTHVGMELSVDDVHQLNSALGINLQSREQLVSRVKSMTSLNLDGLEVTLEPSLLQRLKSRCVRQDFREFVSNEITRQLRAYVGM